MVYIPCVKPVGFVKSLTELTRSLTLSTLFNKSGGRIVKFFFHHQSLLVVPIR